MSAATVQNTPASWAINGQTVEVLHECDAHDGGFVVRMADGSKGCLYDNELGRANAREPLTSGGQDVIW